MAWMGTYQGYVEVDKNVIRVYNKDKKMIHEKEHSCFEHIVDECYEWFLKGYDVDFDYLPDHIALIYA